MASSPILLVEDNPHDEALTLRAFRKNNITNEVAVARDGAEAHSLGANSYLRKPVDFAEFVDAARQLGLYWLLLNERPPAPNPLRPGANTHR